MRALRKGPARPWCLQPGIRGEVRLVERAFGIGPSALTEAMGMLNHHFAAAALSAQSDSLPLTAANLCNRAPHRAPRRQCLSPAMVMDFDQGALPEPRLVGRQFLFAAAGRGDEAQGFRAWLEIGRAHV